LDVAGGTYFAATERRNGPFEHFEFFAWVGAVLAVAMR
jgi:hypothetical protein